MRLLNTNKTLKIEENRRKWITNAIIININEVDNSKSYLERLKNKLNKIIKFILFLNYLIFSNIFFYKNNFVYNIIYSLNIFNKLKQYIKIKN